MRPYDTPYYIIHSDLPEPDVREVAIRMTRTAEAYHERTSEFSGTIRQLLPVYLFRSEVDYQAGGGPPGTGGCFDGRSLMAVTGDHPTDRTWHVIQHEAFHQFAHAVIGGKLPIWVNEGLAEYFGEGLFTGDNFATGFIPADRLRFVKRQIEDRQLKHMRDMMVLTAEQWTLERSIANYDQAWSMVHFLAHAEGGKYQPAFSTFMREIARGRPWMNAWEQAFGKDVDGFETKWREYWMKLPDDPTADLYAQATTATLTSFLARAWSQQQTFETFGQFLAMAAAGQLRANREDWLPPSLLAGALAKIGEPEHWSIDVQRGKLPRLVQTLPDQRTIVGSFLIQNGRAVKVTAELVTPKPLARPTSRPAVAPGSHPAPRAP